jgi:hypothetical protein
VKVLRRRRLYCNQGRPHRGADAFVTATAIIFVAVVLWVALTNGRGPSGGIRDGHMLGWEVSATIGSESESRSSLSR